MIPTPKNGVIVYDESFYTPEMIASLRKLAFQSDLLKSYFMERHNVVEGMFMALLSRNHTVLVGPPGTGKSYLIESFVKGFSGMNLFTWQLNKFSQMEELFGPYSLLALKAGKYERVSDHKLQNADVAYLDEVYNGNSSILNAFNSLMNERVFERMPAPLQSIFSGTNFIPEDNVLLAFHDRFLFRYIINEIASQKNFEDMLMMDWYNLDPQYQLSKEDLHTLQGKLEEIQYNTILPMITKVREALIDEKIFPSSRRFKWAIKALQAHAMLDGRAQVMDEDLLILKDILWVDKKDIPVVEKIVAKTVNPALNEIQDLLNQAQDIATKAHLLDPRVDKDLVKVLESMSKLKKVTGEIKEIMRTRQLTPRLMEVANRIVADIQKMQAELKKAKIPIDF